MDARGGGHSGCAKNAEKNSLKKTGDRLLKLLKPLLKKQAGDNDFTRLGSVRYDGDPLDWETSGSLPAGNAPSVKSQPNSNFLPFTADTLPAALLLTPSLSKAGKAQRFAGFVSSVGSSGSAAVTISAAKTFALAA